MYTGWYRKCKEPRLDLGLSSPVSYLYWFLKCMIQLRLGIFKWLFMPSGRQVKGRQQWSHDNQLGRGWLERWLTPEPFQAVWNPTWDSEGTEEHFGMMTPPHWFPLTGIRTVPLAPKMVHGRRRATRAMKYLVRSSFRTMCSALGIHCSSGISLWLWLCE